MASAAEAQQCKPQPVAWAENLRPLVIAVDGASDGIASLTVAMNNQCLQILIQDTKGAIDDIKPKFPNVVDVSFEEHDPRDPQPAGRKVSAFYIAKGPTILLLPDAEFCTILGRLHDAAHASGKMFSYLVIDYPVALEQVGKSNKDIKRDRDGIIELLKKENWKEIHPSFQAGGLMAPAAMTIFAGPV